MAAVVGVTLAILIIFLVLVIALLIAYKKEKMCFKRKREPIKSASTSSTLHYVDPMTVSNKAAKVAPLPWCAPKKIKEDLNENTYTNEAYKLYLSDHKHDYTHQNTKNLSSTELISSHESLPSLGYPGPSVSHLPGYNSLHHHYSSTHSLQGQTNYSMPPHLNNYIIDSDQPILSRFPSSLAGSNSRSNLQIYSQLQVPSASNFGSMKKKKNGKKNSRSDASSDLSQQLDQNYSQNQGGESSSADASATYVPDFISITNKPVKVWMVVNIPKITGISNGLRVFPSVISKPKLV